MYVSQGKRYIRFDSEDEMRSYFTKKGHGSLERCFEYYKNETYPLFLKRDESPDTLCTVGDVYYPIRDFELDWLRDEYEDLKQLFEEDIEALEKQKTVIEKLENMKEKIQELAYYDTDYCGFALPEWKVSDIIYDYIRELKGE